MATKVFKKMYVNELEKGRQVFGGLIALAVMATTIYNIWGVVSPMDFHLAKVIMGHIVILTAGIIMAMGAEIYYNLSVSGQITEEMRRPFFRYMGHKTIALIMLVLAFFGTMFLIID